VEYVAQFVPARIYRLGTVGTHSDPTRPILNPDSFDGLFLRASVQLQAYPALKGFTIPYSDVDWAANVISNALLTPIQPGEIQILNIVQRNFFHSDLFQELKVPPMEPEDWFKKFLHFAETNQHDSRSQGLRIILEQRPWRRLGWIQNMFGVLRYMPRISYPRKTESFAEDPPVVPEIWKYIHLHLQ
jgi:hypothetical protein